MEDKEKFLVLPVPKDREPETVPEPSPIPVFPLIPFPTSAPKIPSGILTPAINRVLMQFMIPILVPPSYYPGNDMYDNQG